MSNEIFFVSLIVFMGTANCTVDIACIPANFKECYDSSRNIIFMMNKFYAETMKATFNRKATRATLGLSV